MNHKQKILVLATVSICFLYIIYVITFEKEEKVSAKEPIVEEKIVEPQEPIMEKYKVDINELLDGDTKKIKNKKIESS